MKKNLFVGIGAFVVLFVVLFAGVAFARENENEKENRGFGFGVGQMMKNMVKSFKDEAKETGSNLEVRFNDDGSVVVNGAKVTGVSGSTINAVSTWGAISFNWSVNTSNTTLFVRKYGGKSSLSEVATGDFLSFNGNLVTTSASPIIVNAKNVKNWSVQQLKSAIEGTVKSVDTTANKFVVTTPNKGDVTVVTSSSTKFKKAGNVVTLADVVVGAKVMSRGVLNTQTMQLNAEEVRIGDTNTNPVPSQNNLIGTVKSISGSTLVVTTSGVDYTVTLTTSTAVFNNVWAPVALSTYAVGNTVQVFGSVDNTAKTVTANAIKQQ